MSSHSPRVGLGPACCAWRRLEAWSLGRFDWLTGCLPPAAGTSKRRCARHLRDAEVPMGVEEKKASGAMCPWELIYTVRGVPFFATGNYRLCLTSFMVGSAYGNKKLCTYLTCCGM